MRKVEKRVVDAKVAPKPVVVVEKVGTPVGIALLRARVLKARAELAVELKKKYGAGWEARLDG